MDEGQTRIFCECGYSGEAKFADENGLGRSGQKLYDPETGTGIQIARLNKTYQPGEKYCPLCGRAITKPESVAIG